MVNFYPSFLDARTNKEENERSAKLKDQIMALREQYKDNPKGYDEAERKLMEANPIYITPYTRIVDHIDHIRDVAGIDHVGLGSDFDGVPMLPAGMNGAEDLVLVTYEMLKPRLFRKRCQKSSGRKFPSSLCPSRKSSRQPKNKRRR